jgi:cytochrome oxidase Cu insertion factor (SCO1/SenC/PrrC family)
MRKLNEAHRGHPDFQQLSLALAPERDNASFLKSYAEGIGVKPGDPWWFLTGPQQGVWDYLTQAQKLDPPRPIPEEKRLNPLDFYEHDLRIVVLDRQGRVRGYYSVFHPQPEIAETMSQKLARDVERLLENPAD